MYFKNELVNLLDICCIANLNLSQCYQAYCTRMTGWMKSGSAVDIYISLDYGSPNY